MSSFLRFPQRRVFPEVQPLVCVTFFSHQGIDDLQHTYAAAVPYLDAQRGLDSTAAASSLLRYELVWIDNGGPQTEHARFVERGAQFEISHRNSRNEGIFRAVNDAWFRGRGCRAPYVLSLEDDRVPRPDLATSAIPHLALAIDVLTTDVSVAGVRLKDEWSDDHISVTADKEAQAKGVTRAASVSGRGLRFMHHCMKLNSGWVWGSFSLAAVLYDRERLRYNVGLLMEGGK